jgi:hypothetical protein
LGTPSAPPVGALSEALSARRILAPSALPAATTFAVADRVSAIQTNHSSKRTRKSSHHSSHPAGVTGWTSRLRLLALPVTACNGRFRFPKLNVVGSNPISRSRKLVRYWYLRRRGDGGGWSRDRLSHHFRTTSILPTTSGPQEIAVPASETTFPSAAWTSACATEL